ncbi:Uma2 family endonuclease [Streptomyces sp. SCA3-4]|uniref:Uma2 family endonuclease n=1 Tax=Streptomyces sichuanensis TaxID=2871810 RepID=UPI001CE32D50|nr:Uma2 family endonuclease [Streptomyces sichuanensis]MCA6091539.1 Uma2 family endonuclease [Streptomyces sichuanensis]
MAVMVDIPREALQPIDSEGGENDFEQLCRDLEEANEDLPLGYRAEIIGGNIVMSPWNKGAYNWILDSLEDQLTPHVPKGHRARTTPNLYIFPQQERGYGPDLHVSDRGAIQDLHTILLPGSILSLVAEQTSPSTRGNDLTDKVTVYGKGEVPVYVLIDLQKGLITVYHDPTPDEGYRAHVQVKFGDKVHIPAPFDFELDTVGWKIC